MLRRAARHELIGASRPFSGGGEKRRAAPARARRKAILAERFDWRAHYARFLRRRSRPRAGRPVRARTRAAGAGVGVTRVKLSLLTKFSWPPSARVMSDSLVIEKSPLVPGTTFEI